MAWDMSIPLTGAQKALAEQAFRWAMTTGWKAWNRWGGCVDDWLSAAAIGVCRAAVSWREGAGCTWRSWAIKTARRYCRNLARSTVANRCTKLLADIPACPGSGEQLRAMEASEEIESQMRKLPGLEREALSLVTVEGLTWAQAATRLGVSLGTLRDRLASARARLAGGDARIKAKARKNELNRLRTLRYRERLAAAALARPKGRG